MIDELDRCRPSYATELLEIAKHLFSVDRIVFVLAINRSELAHSVKALYGSKFDAKGYLGRFFDLDYLLPAPDRQQFVLQVMSDSGLGALFQKESHLLKIVPNAILLIHEAQQGCRDATYEPSRFPVAVPYPSPHRATPAYVVVTSSDLDTSRNKASVSGLSWINRNAIARLLASSSLDLRRITQTIHRLSLVCGSLDSASPASTTAAAVLLSFRESQPELYAEFVAGTIDDLDFVEKMYQNNQFDERKFSYEGYFLESTVCQAWFELASRSARRLNDWEASRLYKNYRSTIANARERFDRETSAGQWKGANQEEESGIRRAEGVLDMCKGLQRYADEMRFATAIKRIELLPIS